MLYKVRVGQMGDRKTKRNCSRLRLRCAGGRRDVPLTMIAVMIIPSRWSARKVCHLFKLKCRLKPP